MALLKCRKDHDVPGRTREDDVPDGYEPRQLLDVRAFRSRAKTRNVGDVAVPGRTGAFPSIQCRNEKPSRYR